MSKAASQKKSQLEKFSNSAQLILWTAVFGLSLASFLCLNCAEWTRYAGQLTVFASLVCRLAQALQVTDFMARGSFIGKALHIFGRNLIAWAILPYVPNAWFANALMMVWGLGDMIRYSYYLRNDDTTAILRYNVFLINYPLGLSLEFLCIYNGHVHGTLNKNIINTPTIAVLIPLMIFGFQICFRQLYQQRMQYYARKLKPE